MCVSEVVDWLTGWDVFFHGRFGTSLARDETSSSGSPCSIVFLGPSHQNGQRQFRVVKGNGILCYPVYKGCSCVAQWLALCGSLYTTSDRSSHLHFLATLHQPERRLRETFTVFPVHMPKNLTNRVTCYGGADPFSVVLVFYCGATLSAGIVVAIKRLLTN